MYAFGHRFLGIGPTDLPFTRSEVITLLANVNTSFKISSARELMGVISQDRNTAVSGQLGQRAAMVPLEISVTRDSKAVEKYRMQMVNDRFLSPFLMQMAVFSAIDATERAMGASSIAGARHHRIRESRRARAAFETSMPPMAAPAMQAAIATAVPLAYLMQGGFDALSIKRVSVQLQSFDEKRDLNIGQVYLSRKEAKAGRHRGTP